VAAAQCSDRPAGRRNTVMGNFYRDNKDIENVIDALDLTEVATLLE
jgi:hypothetical protein